MKSFSSATMQLAANNLFLCRIPPFKAPFEHCTGLFGQLFEYLGEIIDEHMKQHAADPDMEPRDFIDAYLVEMVID
jgi:hypothetical protein